MADKNYSIGYKFTGDASGFTRTMGEMNRSMGSVEKSINKFKSLSGVFAAIGTAVVVAKKAMNSTEGSADSLEKVMGTLQGTMQGVFRTIVTGDWDQLIKNIVNTAKATRDLKVAMDELEDIVSTNKIRKALFEGQLEEARLGAAGTTDPGKRATFIQAAIDAQKNLTAIEKKEVDQRIAIEEEYFKTMMGWPDDIARFNIEKIKEIAKNYEYFFGENSAVVEGINISLSRLEQGGNKDQEYWRLKTLKSSLDIFKQLRDVSDPGRFRQYVELIAEGYAVTAKGAQDLVRLTKQFTTASAKGDKENIGIIASLVPSELQLSRLRELENIYKRVYNYKAQGLQSAPGQGYISAEQISKVQQEATESNLDAIMKAQDAADQLAGTFATLFASMEDGWKSFGDTAKRELMRVVEMILAKAAIFAILKLLGLMDNGVGNWANQALQNQTLLQYTGITTTPTVPVTTTPTGMSYKGQTINVNLTGGVSGDKIQLAIARSQMARMTNT